MPNNKIGYHTQEHRGRSNTLQEPIFCNDEEVWLGAGYYFWTDESFAHIWGRDKKNATGAYDIYKANINIENTFDLSDDDMFNLFIDLCKSFEQCNKDQKYYTKADIWEYILENSLLFRSIDVVKFHDFPNMGKHSFSKPSLFFKRREQLAVLNKEAIISFNPYKLNNKIKPQYYDNRY